MTAAYFFFLYSILTFSADSCPTSYPFSCGNVTLDIRYPFFTNISNHQCPGLHHIDCMNLNPVILFHRQEFIFPLYDILYSEKAVIVHDLKLSAFFRGSECVFLYNFTHPIPLFNVSYLSQLINSGQSFFNCELKEYDFSHDIFNEFYNSTFCNDYNLYYSYQSEGQIDDGSSHNCSTSGNLWFDWKLSFSEEKNNGDISLLSAGFSREWLVVPDCFDCQTAGGNCGSSNSVGNSTCGCSNACRSVIKSSTGDKAAKWTLIAIGISSSALVVASLLFFYFCSYQKFYNSVSLWKRNSMTGITVEAFLERYGSPTPKRYSYSDVKKITKSFREKIGKGGYGTVFKGNLLDSGCEVAVKMLNKSKSSGEEFFNEVASIGRTSHVNIVSLLGFCSEGSKRALIYDYMPNGSLEKFIYVKQPKTMLGWDKLFEIAVGIARGLEYLHRGCNTRIVHFDIKPHNILLDQDYCPKIADFGLAKLCPPKESVLSMVAARGTVGYIAPEVFSRNFGSVTSKSDVYSYGMMVLEMVGGRRNVDVHVSNTSEVYFPHWIYDHLDEDGYLHRCEVTAETEEIAKKMIIVGLWCVQTMPRNRPSMSDVVEMLEGSVQDLQIPPKPHLSSPS